MRYHITMKTSILNDDLHGQIILLLFFFGKKIHIRIKRIHTQELQCSLYLKVIVYDNSGKNRVLKEDKIGSH